MSAERVGGCVHLGRRRFGARREDVYTARCEGCSTLHGGEHATTKRARAAAQADGWSAELLRVRTRDGGETRVWRVVCPACAS